MADHPLVSVLMPAYNASRYVAEAVDSILAQTFADFEFLIVDDGSTDDTPRILQDYADKDSRVRIFTQPNGGVGAALNRGLAEVRGEFIARMDADDISLPERLQREIDFLRNRPDCVLVGSRVLLIDADGEPLFEMPGIPLEHEQIDRLLMRADWAIVHPSTMMRRDAVLRVGGYRADLVPVEDHDLFLRLAEIGHLANLPDVLLQYRKHPMNSVRVLADRRVGALSTVMNTAWERRGITDRTSYPTILPDADRDDPRRELKQKRNWGWLCLKAGNVVAARKYAMAGLREAPLAYESWKLMVCVLRGH